MSDIFREIKQDVIFFSTKSLDFPAHIHEDIELVFTAQGGGMAYCEGTKYTLSDRSFFLAFPNQVHHYTDCKGGDYILLIIKTSALRHVSHSLRGSPVSALLSFADRDDEHLIDLLNMCLEEYTRNGYSAIVDAYLTAFFEKLLTFYEIQETMSSENTVSRVLRYCAEHFKDDISVADIAEALQISRSSVSHLFSRRLGISFSDHIHTLRLNDAVHLLKSSRYSITEIADRSGFSTIRTFNRAFRKQYGMSPSDFRKQPFD